MLHRAVIHMDLDAFFASVEVKKRPELKGKPVIVGAEGDPAKRGVVSAASYEARKTGVSSGMPLRRALKLCPDAVFLPVDFEAYEEESDRFMRILRETGLPVESFGLDEAFVEVPVVQGAEPLAGAVGLARELKQKVRKELGLTVSVGVAPNKLLAKLACELEKPDGFFVIHENEVAATLKDLPVRKLWGVGPKTGARLERLGITTIGELASVPGQFLERNFGPNIGKSLHEHSRGLDLSPVVPFFEPGSMSRELTFEEDTSDKYVVRETLYALTEDVVARLKDSMHRCSTVSIKVRFSDFHTITRSVTLPAPTDSMNEVWNAAHSLFESVKAVNPIRLVGVKASHLELRKKAGAAAG